MDEKNDQIAHRRIVAGRGIPRNHARINNSPATGQTAFSVGTGSTIGDTVYSLHDTTLLHMVVEFLITDSKGKLDGAKVYVIGMTAKPQEKPKD